MNKHVWAYLRYHQSFLLFLCAHHKTMIMLNIRLLLIAQSSVHNIKTISVLTARHMFNYSVRSGEDKGRFRTGRQCGANQGTADGKVRTGVANVKLLGK